MRGRGERGSQKQEGGVTYWTSKIYFSYISLSEQEKGTKERWLIGEKRGRL